MTGNEKRGIGAAMRQGAGQGFLAFAIYAVAECFFASVAPWFFKPASAYGPVHRGFTAIALVALPLFGAVAGALAGTVLRRGTAPVLGTVALIVAFDWNLFFVMFRAPHLFEASSMHLAVPAALSLVPLGAALAARFSGDGVAERVRFLTNPWAVSVLLTGVPYTTLHLLSAYGSSAKILGGLAFALAVGLVALLLARVRGGAAVALGGLAAAGTLAIAWTADQVPEVTGEPPAFTADDARRPGVLLIVLDTTRASNLSVYGYGLRTTPILEAFAEGATVYRNAVSSGDMTLTTHGSLFTGLSGTMHGAHRSERTPGGRPLSDRFTTVAERLLAENYWTAAVVGNRGYVTPHFGFAQGFLSFDARGPVTLLGHANPYYLRRVVRAWLIPWMPRETFDRLTRRAGEINGEAFPFLEKAAERGGPFFLFLNYMDPHNPYIPPAPYDTMFPGKDESFRSADYERLLAAVVRDGTLEVPERQRRHIESQYDGEIAYLDSELGRLFAHLRQTGAYDNTLILVTSDHGEALGERNRVNHGVSVYENQVSVPLLIKLPGQTEPGRVDERVHSVDLLPTILDVLGLPVPEGLPGVSLAPLQQDDEARSAAVRAVLAERSVVAESFSHGADSGLNRTERALYHGNHKIIRSDQGRAELYHLEHDPQEADNLWDSAETGVRADLEARLDAWLEDNPALEDTSQVAIDPEMEARLRALGYQ